MTRLRLDRSRGAGEEPGAGDRRPQREWRILAPVLVGTFMGVLDTTIVNVALPSIAGGTHARGGGPGMGSVRVRAGIRPGTGASGPARRPVRVQAAIRDRPDRVHPGEPGLRAVAGPGQPDRGQGGAGGGCRNLLPGGRCHHPAALLGGPAQPRVRLFRRGGRHLRRGRAAAGRAADPVRRHARRLALGVPCQRVHRGGSDPGCHPAAAPAAAGGAAPAGPGGERPARRDATAAADPAGGGTRAQLAAVELADAGGLRARCGAAVGLGDPARPARRRAGHPGGIVPAALVRGRPVAGAALLRRVQHAVLHPVDPVAAGAWSRRAGNRPAGAADGTGQPAHGIEQPPLLHPFRPPGDPGRDLRHARRAGAHPADDPSRRPPGRARGCWPARWRWRAWGTGLSSRPTRTTYWARCRASRPAPRAAR